MNSGTSTAEMLMKDTEALFAADQLRQQRLFRVAKTSGEFAVHGYITDTPNDHSDSHVDSWGIEARKYQIGSWQAISDARTNGETKALVHLATGLGKTTIAVIDALRYIDEQIDETHETSSGIPKILFACHQNEILQQASERFGEFAPDLMQSWFRAGAENPNADITFATLQSLQKSLDLIDPGEFDYIIYDEAHHGQADTFREVIQHFNPDFQLALTATPDRMDGKDIRELFGDEVYVKTLEEALVEGWLAEVDYHIVLEKSIQEAISSGEFNPATLDELYSIFGSETVNEAIAEQIHEETERLGLENAKSIIFCQDIEQANAIAELVNGKAYHSQLTNDERQQILEEFRSNGLQTIVTRDMFNEGVDIPDATLLVFLRATSSHTIFQQQLGRGLRKQPGKDKVSVLDFVSNIERLEHIKELAEKVQEAAERHNEDNPELEGDPVVIDDVNSEKFLSMHAEFDFQKVAVNVLEKLGGLKRDTHFRSLTSEEIIETAIGISPDEKLTVEEIKELASGGQFASYNLIIDRFGSMAAFHEACGFEEDAITPEWLVERALELSPDEKLTIKAITELNKAGQFVGRDIVKRHFGSIAAFQKACGFGKEEITPESLVERALELSPDEKLTVETITELSKAGKFVSYATIRKHFDSIAAFQKACGFGKEEITPESLVERALELSPDEKLTESKIQELSQAGVFVSRDTIRKHFGSMAAFQEACGFSNARKGLDAPEKIIQRALELSPDEKLTESKIQELSQTGKFVSPTTIAQHFGGLVAFQEACGFVDSTKELDTPEAVVERALELSPDEKLTAKRIDELSKAGKFVSYAFIRKHFGGMAAFYEACGFSE